MDVSKGFWKDCDAVEEVSGRLTGKPVVKNSRVAAETVLECEELGETPEETASNYGLALRDVLKILEYAHAHDRALTA